MMKVQMMMKCTLTKIESELRNDIADQDYRYKIFISI